MTTTELATLVAAVTALGATVFLPILKNVFGFKTEKLNDDASWRKYLADELAKRDDKIAELEKWRDLYHEQLLVNTNQATEIITLRDDNNELKERVQQLQELVSKNAGIVQDNANNVSNAMKTAKKEINKI